MTRLETAPPGLLMVADFMERMPDRAEDLLNHEIGRRERELVLMQETRSQLSWHPWNTVRFLILSGIVAFAVAWLFSILMELAKLYNETLGSKFGIPFAGEGLLNLGAHLPEKIMPILSDLPDFGAVESFFFALGVVLLVAFAKLVFIMVNWKKIKLLGEAERELQEELRALGSWKKELKDEPAVDEAS